MRKHPSGSRRAPRLRRTRAAIICLTAISPLLSACATWRLAPIPPAQLIQEQDPNQVRVRRAGGETMTLQSPELVQDSVVGTSRGSRASLPLSDVEAIEVRRISVFRTTALILGIVVVAVPAVTMFVGCAAVGGCSGYN